MNKLALKGLTCQFIFGVQGSFSGNLLRANAYFCMSCLTHHCTNLCSTTLSYYTVFRGRL